MPGTPEGLVADDPGGILAVGLRRPDAVALVNVTTGRVRKIVRLPGAPRHLQLAGPAGPVLVPAEQADQLVQLALPSGKVVADTHVGHQPHDAAAAGRLESFRISGNGLVPDRIWPAVRQPNDVAVDEATGQVFVAGTDDDQLQLIAPGTGGSAASLPQPPHDEHDRDSGAGPAAVVQQPARCGSANPASRTGRR